MSLAFFDIDGTLLPKPSLERRFFRELRRQRRIPAANYIAWLAEAVRLAPRDAWAATHANKMYLRGVFAEALSAALNNPSAAWVLDFFPAAMQRVWSHVLHGDSIVLVSGTLLPLAEIVKFALQRELLWRGVESRISVLATPLQVCDGRWSGRLEGPAMFGEAKAHAIRHFAEVRQASLPQCSAYGDSSLDRWMLAAVGHPFAINPTPRLQRVAEACGWQKLDWTHCPMRTAPEQRESKIAAKRDCKWIVLKKKDLAGR